MKNRIDNNIISRFLLEPRFHIYRHLLLQLIIFIISIDVLFDTPTKLVLSKNSISDWIGFVVLLNLTIYVNIAILAPRFLLKNKHFHYLIFIALLIIVSVVFLVFLQIYFYDASIPHEESGDIPYFISITSSVLTLGFAIVGTSALSLFKHWISDSQRVSELESATLESELKFLKSQINPHFLFNMLNNANIMVDEDPEVASRILVKLDDLIRYQINDSTQDKVYLSADISFLTDYLDLEKTRRDQFDYTISVEGAIDNFAVAPLLFIPFVENAVKHNMDSENLSYIHILFKIENDRLTFICKNSKPVKAVKREEGGLGLMNIKRRLDLLYANNYWLEHKETNSTYTVHLILNI